MKIAILGTGCPKCNKLLEAATEAVKKAGVDAEIIKVTKISEISGYGVMVTPAIAIDGAVKASGRVPSVEEIAGWIKTGA